MAAMKRPCFGLNATNYDCPTNRPPPSPKPLETFTGASIYVLGARGALLAELPADGTNSNVCRALRYAQPMLPKNVKTLETLLVLFRNSSVVYYYRMLYT